MVKHQLRCVADPQEGTTLGDSHGYRGGDHEQGGEHEDKEKMPGTVRRDSAEAVMNMTVQTPSRLGTAPRARAKIPEPNPDPSRETDHVARASKDPDTSHNSSAGIDHERSVRLSINLSIESAETLRALIRRKGLTITEGIRRAIAIWEFSRRREQQWQPTRCHRARRQCKESSPALRTGTGARRA